MNSKQIDGRIRWQCRRGMLELDLMLLPVVDHIYPTVSDQEQQTFQHLLTHHDQDLYAWLTERVEPPDPELAKFVKAIIAYAQKPKEVD